MATQGGVIETKTIGLSIGTTGTFVNTELVNGQVQLKKKDNSPFLHEEGEWISPVVDIGDNFQSYGKVFTTHVNSGSSSIAVLTRTSDNGIDFDAWTATAMDGSILSVKRRYISIKVVFYAAWGIQNIVISSLNNQTEALKFFNSEWIDTSNGLKLRRNHEIEMAKSSTWSDTGTLHKNTMTRNDWTKINTLNVKKNGNFLGKTLILSKEEYKNFNPSSPEGYSDNLIPVMTSNTTPSGEAFASSSYDSNYLPYKAFNRTNTSSSDIWGSTYTDGNSGNAFIGYDFKTPVIVNKIMMEARYDSPGNNVYNTTARYFDIEGWNGLQWVVIKSNCDIGQWTILKEVKEYTFNNNTPFTKYRLNKIRAQSGSYGVTVAKLEMYSKISSTPPSWSTVSSTLPTSTQFIEQGMDSLSPLLDRKLTTLEPQEMTQDTTWTESGRVFKKSIDLKKYFDIRSINITN